MFQYIQLNSSIKEKKEAFVSGHEGSNPWEVLLVCSSAPIGIYLFLELIALLGSISPSGKVSVSVAIALEMTVLLIPMVLCQTNLLYPFGIALLVFELVVATVLSMIRSQLCANHDAKSKSVSSFGNKNQKIVDYAPYLTCYRSTISYLTFIAILAVDFSIFPRSFAKTEAQGYGLMDIGAASFCISGGMVSSFAKGKDVYTSNLLKRIGPLVLMGFIRLVSTKGIQYQEHVTEYGVHWNFFFTLAIVSLLSSVIRAMCTRYISTINSWLIPSVLLILYQCSLTYLNIQQYIEDAPRACGKCNFTQNFFAANREGILGSIGYLIIYLLGESIGKYCIWDVFQSEGKGSILHGIRTLKITILFWILHFISTRCLNIPVSRRSTNSSFILWVLAHNISIFFLIWLAFSFAFRKSGNLSDAINPSIFAATNRQGLKVFILANLLTGAVNLCMNTLETSDSIALILIIAYVLSVGAASFFMDSNVDYTFSYVEHKVI